MQLIKLTHFGMEMALFANSFFCCPSLLCKLTSHYQGFKSLCQRKSIDLQVNAIKNVI